MAECMVTGSALLLIPGIIDRVLYFRPSFGSSRNFLGGGGGEGAEEMYEFCRFSRIILNMYAHKN